MMTEDFFASPTEQSSLKAEIVTTYFRGWANVMIAEAKKKPNPRLGYVDLFSGPGVYEDGTKSTPIRIIEEAIKDPNLRSMLSIHFNDGDPEKAAALRSAIAGIDGVRDLENEPVVTSEKVTTATAKQFEKTNFDPTLFFLDPWGYKGLTLRLIKPAIRCWGCDVIFFFNYTRMNAAVSNDLFADHVNELFGAERARTLRPRLEGLPAAEREAAVIEALKAALREEGGRYVLAFPFSTDSGARTSHHLVFVSKGKKGHDIMKRIMAKRSSARPGGVPGYRYNPADVRQPSLLDLIDEGPQRLADDLVVRFAGRSITFGEMFDEHNVDQPYQEKHYRAAIRLLETAGRVTTSPPAEARRRVRDEVTVPMDVVLTFPRRKA